MIPFRARPGTAPARRTGWRAPQWFRRHGRQLVSHEAARTLAYLGWECRLFEDCGVAGLWRIEEALPEIAKYDAVIAVAGMDAALATVLGGLYGRPIFAVPTSVGYGVCEQGLTALRGMLASCAPASPSSTSTTATAPPAPRPTCSRLLEEGPRRTDEMKVTMNEEKPTLLTVRIHAGFNAAAFLGGILALTWQSGGGHRRAEPPFPRHRRRRRLRPRFGQRHRRLARIEEPHEHVHRHLSDIAAIYDKSGLSAAAAPRRTPWNVLGRAEAAVHGIDLEDVHFHEEVGRMASILAVGLIAEFLTRLGGVRLSASPIPMTDSTVLCAHGAVPPSGRRRSCHARRRGRAPLGGQSEPVTPTGLAAGARPRRPLRRLAEG